MIEKFCTYLTKKIQKENSNVDDERAEVIKYGLQLIIGEIPKLLLIVFIAFALGIGWLVLFTYITLLPYKVSSGGFHCKTHVGCFIGTCVMYFGTVFLAKFLNIESLYKYILIGLVWVFGIIMIKLYAPADTENVPILCSKDRKKKKILSYIFLTVNLIIAIIFKNEVLANIIILSVFLQTCTITRVAYKLSGNKYGYETVNI